MTRFIDSRHLHYDDFYDRWRFYLNSYEGGRDYLEGGYLFRHFREDEPDYQDRAMRSYYYNFCRTVVDTYVSHIFQQTTAIYRNSGGTREYDRFLANVDGKGNGIDLFMQEQAAPAAQIFGHVHILMDKPPISRRPISLAEKEALKLSPYLTLIYPENFLDFRLDSKGDFIWVRTREIAPSPDGPFTSMPAEPRFQYRTWTQTNWYIHNDNGAIITSGAHNLGRVPIVTVVNVHSKKYPRCGVSALGDIAPINRSIYNWCSLNDEFLYRQCFNILAIPQVPGSKFKKVGTMSALAFPYDAAKTPFYIYPPVEPGEYLLRNINDAIIQIYRIAMLGMHELEPLRQVQSGVAKAYDFQRANQNMVKKARNLEQAEIAIGELWGLWQGKRGFRPVVEYPSDYNINSLAEQLRADFELIQMNISDTFNKTLKKRMAQRVIKLRDAEQKKVFSEIDSAVAVIEQTAKK